jgi:predicted dehydrogenase
MRLAARKNKVVTQMGNQIQSHWAYRTAVKAVHDGLIGKVKEVISWQAGVMKWMLVDDRPAGMDPVPKGVHWDEWLGVAPERPYKEKVYHSFNWRAWQDFSNGQLGDFGCHILDPVFLALKLTAPTTIRAEAPPINRELWTKKARVMYTFPGTEHTTDKTLRLTWYDGEGHYPPREALGLPRGAKRPPAGSVLLGEKGTLVIPHIATPRAYAADGSEVKFEKVEAINHYTGWADACRGAGKTGSAFDYSGPLSECVLLGTIAIRLPETTLTWDAESMKLTGGDAAAMLTKKYRKGWEPAWVS